MSRGTHTGVVGERDRLRAENEQLELRVKAAEASTKSLTAERDATLEQYEDLRVAHEDLLGESERLRQTELALSHRLADQDAELQKSQQELEVARSEVGRLTSTYTTLMSDLEAEVASGQIQIQQLREGVFVNVENDVLFASGSAELDPVGEQVLRKVAAQLTSQEHDVEVLGHTDDRPIRGDLTSRYPTNWELAAARAARVVRLLEEVGVDGERLTVVSRASFRPVAPNDTPENRARNRRIELRLKPRTKPVAGEAPAPAGGETAPRQP